MKNGKKCWINNKFCIYWDSICLRYKLVFNDIKNDEIRLSLGYKFNVLGIIMLYW